MGLERGLEMLRIGHTRAMKPLAALVTAKQVVYNGRTAHQTLLGMLVQYGRNILARTAHTAHVRLVEQLAYAHKTIPVAIGYTLQLWLKTIRVTATIAVVTQEKLVLVGVTIADLTYDFHDRFVPRDRFEQLVHKQSHLAARLRSFYQATPAFELARHTFHAGGGDLLRILLDELDERLRNGFAGAYVLLLERCFHQALVYLAARLAAVQ